MSNQEDKRSIHIPSELKLNILEFDSQLHLKVSREELLEHIQVIDPTYTHVITPINIHEYRHLFGYDLYMGLKDVKDLTLGFVDRTMFIHSDDEPLLHKVMNEFYDGYFSVEEDEIKLEDGILKLLMRDIYCLQYTRMPRYDFLTFELDGYYCTADHITEYISDHQHLRLISDIQKSCLTPLIEKEDLTPHLEIALKRVQERKRLESSRIYDIFLMMRDVRCSIDKVNATYHVYFNDKKEVSFPKEMKYETSDDHNEYTTYIFENTDVNISLLTDLAKLYIIDDNRFFMYAMEGYYS